MLLRSAGLALAALLGLAANAFPAPFVPDNDRQVLERLPIKPGDPVARELRRLRTALAANPEDAASAEDLARRYFELAMAEGDPRYVGYAEAALRPWSQAQRPFPARLRVVRAMLRQYKHDFAGALQDLDAVADDERSRVEAHSWRAAIYMVQAEYAKARAACIALQPLVSELFSTGCLAYVDATTGAAAQAYARLSAALLRHPKPSTTASLWNLTRLAEMAQWLGDRRAAERHFRAALALDITDNFLLAAYADFLLAAGRPQEVITLLKERQRSDTLLLRLAIAEKALDSPLAAGHVRALGGRFAAAARRGEQLHLQEEARFLLELQADPPAALRAAALNWKTQREPRDAAILMQAALAARDPRAAQPALEWLDASSHEDPRLQGLAGRLREMAR